MHPSEIFQENSLFSMKFRVKQILLLPRSLTSKRRSENGSATTEAFAPAHRRRVRFGLVLGFYADQGAEHRKISLGMSTERATFLRFGAMGMVLRRASFYVETRPSARSLRAAIRHTWVSK